MTTTTRELSIEIDDAIGRVDALALVPDDARAFFVMAHGAGAGMRHAFMAAMAEQLATRRIATLRFQFPYTQAERRRPDPPDVLQRAVRAAVATGRTLAAGLPLVAGGKSMGGRMTTLAAADEPLEGVRGLVLLGFPLHPEGRPGDARAQHLHAVTLPLLFVQGSKDRLAALDRLRPVLAALGPRAHLHVVEQGDHSLRVPKRSGRTDDDVLGEVADLVAAFAGATA